MRTFVRHFEERGPLKHFPGYGKPSSSHCPINFDSEHLTGNNSAQKLGDIWVEVDSSTKHILQGILELNPTLHELLPADTAEKE